ncbi:hypothetical protein CPB84DRAFT_1798642 [Gymnopilus junonius]|uniref:Secreted protein n=1 Tax=Gymnopilus junonius TaxID=109634 RepID=A0A9P5TGS9_GYMJU|nr:hypothetical protein CPB84DRAFT_1798642 [Gymnopilus junonius]
MSRHLGYLCLCLCLCHFIHDFDYSPGHPRRRSLPRRQTWQLVVRQRRRVMGREQAVRVLGCGGFMGWWGRGCEGCGCRTDVQCYSDEEG